MHELLNSIKTYYKSPVIAEQRAFLFYHYWEIKLKERRDYKIDINEDWHSYLTNVMSLQSQPLSADEQVLLDKAMDLYNKMFSFGYTISDHDVTKYLGL